MNAVTVAPEQAEEFPFQQATREEMDHWSALCQKFLDWQRSDILRRDPSPQALDQHRTRLKWLLRFTKALYMTASDPDYPDKRIADELEGRLLQLQESWAMVHDRMPDAKAEKLLSEVFPE